MSKNNRTNIHLTWLLFVGMATIFTMLNNSTATSSENEEEKGNYVVAIQNNHQVRHSSSNAALTKVDHTSVNQVHDMPVVSIKNAYEQTKKLPGNAISTVLTSQNLCSNAAPIKVDHTPIDQARNLLLVSTKEAHCRTKKLSGNQRKSVISTQNVLTDLQREIIASNTLTILEKINALQSVSITRSEIVTKSIGTVNDLVTGCLQEEDMILQCKADCMQHLFDTYKNLDTEIMQLQEQQWRQQLKEAKDQLDFDEEKANRNYAFSMQQKKEEQAMRERELQNELELNELKAAQEAAYQERKRQAELKAQQDELELRQLAALQARRAQEREEAAKKPTTHTGTQNGYSSEVNYQVAIYGSGKVDVNFRLVYCSSAKKRFRLQITLKDSGAKKLDSFITPDIELKNKKNRSLDYSFNISPQTVKKVTKVNISFRWAVKS